MDLASVRAAPGVVAVLSAADIPGRNDVSPVKGDDPMFAESHVEFHGQVIFAVVARSRDAPSPLCADCRRDGSVNAISARWPGP